jgi:hypothetical protein
MQASLNQSPRGHANPSMGYTQNSVNIGAPSMVDSRQNASARKTSQQKNESIKVCIRVRPLLPHELGREEGICYPEHENPDLMTVRVADGQHYIESHYDKVFTQYSQQREVFDFVEGKSLFI